MGFPTKSLRDILEHKNEIANFYSPKFYAFVLYKSEHVHFRNYMMSNFNLLDRNSPDVLFFLLDYPEEWFANNRREDHLELYGENYNYQLQDKEVDVVLKQFDIREFQLPVVITFKSLYSYTSSVFSLTPIQENDFELHGFFHKLLTNLKDDEDYYKRSKALQQQFVYLPSKILENPNKDRMYEVFEKIMEAISLINEEDIKKTPELGALKRILESVLDSFLDSKAIFKEQITNLEKMFEQNDNENIELELEQLRHEADNKVLKLQQKIPYKLKPLDELLPKGNHFFVSVFEANSLSMINSALTTEDLVRNANISKYDYSLCAIGYWKALEIELNIVVADAIRFINEYINRIPSYGKTLRKDELVVNGLRDNGNITRINVNYYKKNKLQDLMFGQLI